MGAIFLLLFLLYCLFVLLVLFVVAGFAVAGAFFVRWIVRERRSTPPPLPQK